MGKHNDELKTLRLEGDTKATEMLDISKKYNGESVPDGEDRKTFDAAGERLMEVKARIAELQPLAEAEKMIDENKMPAGGGLKHNFDAGGSKLISRQEMLRKALLADGGSLLKALGDTARLSLPSSALSAKALASIDSLTGGAGSAVYTTFQPPVEAVYFPTSMRDLFGTGSTDTNHIQYWVWNPITNNAADVPNTLPQTHTTMLPESAVTGALIDENIHVIGHYIPTSEVAMRNIPDLLSTIDNDLLIGLDQKINGLLPWATGAADADGNPTFVGIANRTGFGNFSATTTGGGHTTAVNPTFNPTQPIFERIKRQATYTYLRSRVMPSMAVFSPSTFDDAIFAKASGSGVYMFEVLMIANQPQILGLKLVQDVAATDPITGAANVFVGNPQCGSVIDQDTANVEVGYINAQFVQMQQALRATAAVGLKVPRPAGYSRQDLTVVLS